jgi:inhibitor of KinA sporulation pathway (predicted exonuclease)
VGLAKLAISQVEKIADNIIVALMNFIVNPTDRKNLTPYCRIFIDISQKDRERQFMQ